MVILESVDVVAHDGFRAARGNGTNCPTPRRLASGFECRYRLQVSMPELRKKYPFDTIEAKWQRYWTEHRTFRWVYGTRRTR